jgi:hypothetical protein
METKITNAQKESFLTAFWGFCVEKSACMKEINWELLKGRNLHQKKVFSLMIRLVIFSVDLYLYNRLYNCSILSAD